MRDRVPAKGERLAANMIDVEDMLNHVESLLAFASYSDWDKAAKAKMPITWGVAMDLMNEGDTLEARALGYFLALYGLAGVREEMHAAFDRLARDMLDVIKVDDLLETDETLVRVLPFVAARLRGEEGLGDTPPA